MAGWQPSRTMLYGVLGATGASLMFGAFVGALAEATADTWATEIGVLSSAPPRLVTTGKQVEAGTSGGLTALGSGCGRAGRGDHGHSRGQPGPDSPVALYGGERPCGMDISFLAALAGGTAGMLADSLLGATLQASYFCPQCNKPTESRMHRCGTPTRLVRGLRWITNDVVNLAGTLVGAIVGLAVVIFQVAD